MRTRSSSTSWRRSLPAEGIAADDENELEDRMEEYYQEFEQHGIDNLTVDND